MSFHLSTISKRYISHLWKLEYIGYKAIRFPISAGWILMETSPSMELVALGVPWVVVIQDVNLTDFHEFNWQLGTDTILSRLQAFNSVYSIYYVYIYI